jgi:hypothetical protein
MRYRPSKSVEPPDYDGVKKSLVRISHKTIKLRPGVLHPGDSAIDVFAFELPTPALAILSQFAKLHFWILTVRSGYPSVGRCVHGAAPDSS